LWPEPVVVLAVNFTGRERSFPARFSKKVFGSACSRKFHQDRPVNALRALLGRSVELVLRHTKKMNIFWAFSKNDNLSTHKE
tara:strand:+ start:644 stop:889 length:246 start_codon:yes stop_codon:yes gene_type:complete